MSQISFRLREKYERESPLKRNRGNFFNFFFSPHPQQLPHSTAILEREFSLFGPLALLPLEVENLLDGDRGVIIGNLTLGIVTVRRERNAVVNVENTIGTTWGPDHGAAVHSVVLGVHLTVLVYPTAGDGSPGRGGVAGVLGEEVCGEEVTRDARVELGEAVIRAVEDRKGKSLRVFQVHVNLAVLGVVARLGSRPYVGLELVESQRENGVVRR